MTPSSRSSCWLARLTVPLKATAACFALILLAFWLASLVPPDWDGNWTPHVVRLQPHAVDRFFPFDSVWYQRIATDGYGWDPSRPAVKQDIAFFPLWPMALRLVGWCSPEPQASRWIVVALAACLGFGSVCAFHQLARETLSIRAAQTATWLYALYPAATFLLLSYPTGLLNLLCLLALLGVQRKRFWAAAVCAGLATAGGPLGLGTAMMVWLCAASEWVKNDRRTVSSLLALGALGLVSIAGLLGFIAWQASVFGDPYAFMKAQDAWSAPMSWLARLPRALLQLAILPDFGIGFAYAVHAFQATTLVAFQAGWEKALNTAAEGAALLMVVVCLRCVPRSVVLQGAFTLALFIWFHGSFWLGHATLRLIYCASTTLLGLAWLLETRPRLAGWALGISSAMLFLRGFSAGVRISLRLGLFFF